MTSSATTRLDPQHYVSAVAENSARFVEALTDAPGDARVPTCPEWTADDLLQHLGEVQHFWALIVSTDAVTGEDVAALTPLPRATARAALMEAVAGARGRLVEALTDTDPGRAVWTWAPHDRTVGFVQRRQAHEACIHRLDAELTAAPDGSARTPIDPLLAADGVDEVLRMLSDLVAPDAQVEVEEGRVVRIAASDTGTTWLATMTRVTITEDDRPKSRQGIVVADTDPADGTVRPAAILSGTAEDLDCLLWGRPNLGEIHRTGDATLLQEFEATVHATLSAPAS